MADVIEPIRTHRDRTERLDNYALWVRRVGMALLAAVVVIALLNVVGQRASTVSVSNSAVALSVHAPSTVRPGLLFQTKLSVTARRDLPNAEIVLGSGWFDGLTLNTEEPSPSTEASGPGGSVIFDIGSLKPGETYVQYLEYQVNPTSVSRRSQSVAVRSNGVDAITLDRTMTIVP
jgi:hypothetical protein